MSMMKGTNVLLKVGDGNEISQSFLVIGGLTVTRLILGREIIDGGNVSSGGWRLLQQNAGLAQVRIEGDGIFTDSAAESMIMGYAMAGTVSDYQLLFDTGNMLEVSCMIQAYERRADVTEELRYNIRLESAGEAIYS